MQANDFKFEGICYKINSDGTTLINIILGVN